MSEARAARGEVFNIGQPSEVTILELARMIVELVRDGRKVGISSQSHKAITNLLREVVEARTVGIQPLVAAFDEPVGDQSGEGLAHRRARHPVLLGEAFFTESFVGGGCPGHQTIAQSLVDPLAPCVGGHQIAIAARTVEAASTPPSPVEVMRPDSRT